MINYELRSRLTHLTLCGQDEDGELEWIGTNHEWFKASKLEETLCSE